METSNQTTNQTPTLYTALQARHEKHQYKRGINRGDAPMGMRYNTNFRIIDPTLTATLAPTGGYIHVLLYRTNIITAYRDGRITLNTGGWHPPPTIAAINHVLGYVRNNIVRVGTHRVRGKSQLAVIVWGKGTYRFYDGITLDADGTLISERKPFVGRRISKEQSEAFYAAIKASGFEDMFGVLYGTAEAKDKKLFRRLEEVLADAKQSDKWGSTVAWFKYKDGWNGRGWGLEELPKEKAWARLMAECKQGMYETYEINQTNEGV